MTSIFFIRLYNMIIFQKLKLSSIPAAPLLEPMHTVISSLALLIGFFQLLRAKLMQGQVNWEVPNASFWIEIKII